MILIAEEAQVPLHTALRVFRQSQFYVSLGTVIATVGLVAAAFSGLRRRFDPLLLWFSLFALLYGTRLGIRHLPMWQFGHYPGSFQRMVLGLGYLVPIPAFFFFANLGLLDRMGRVLVAAVSPILVLLSLSTLVVGPRYLLSNINNSVIIIALAVLAIDLISSRNRSADTVLIRRALLLFILSALYENLSLFLHLPDVTVEPFAFVALLVALGTVAARRTLVQEQQLTLIQKELEIAQQIQRSILPLDFPASRHFQVAACYKPMTAVAGDLYDYLLTGEHEAGLLIGDVSGHGVPAALIASMVKLAATSQRHVAADPAAVLKGMNEALCGNTQQQFVTAAYAYLNAETQELRYAAAAHPPMLVLRGDQMIQVEENGLMLALFDFASYSVRSLPLYDGDRIVLYTDGLPEAEDRTDEAFGIDRLKAAILASSKLRPAEAALHIVSAAEQWSASQMDDLTIVVCDYSR